MLVGSSPHTRGAHKEVSVFSESNRIIPAYAGSTPSKRLYHLPARDHPRIRGEHIQCVLLALGRRGSSPHTRGAPALIVLYRAQAGIIPAYAGSTCLRNGISSILKDHPRIRGEHFGCLMYFAMSLGSSPHTRGALLGRGVQGVGTRIIPAYAGSTARHFFYRRKP